LCYNVFVRFGKLSPKELESCVLTNLGGSRREVVLSAALGEDCAALKTDGYILLSADPITAPMPPEALGALAVDAACNDIAANGGEPIALLLTLLMPPDSDTEQIGRIMRSASDRAKELNVTIAGGHTEFSDCVTRPVVSAAAAGKAVRLITKKGIRAGDAIFITKSAAIEGAVILAQANPRLLNKADRADLERLKRLLSVAPEGKILAACESVTALHDVTEGGVLGAAAEIAESVGLGAGLYESLIPLEPLTQKLCAALKIDPYRLVSSGSLMFTGGEDAAKALVNSGIAAAKIGGITAKRGTLFYKKDGSVEEVKPEPDQLFSHMKPAKKPKKEVRAKA
jgi:hydrogenase maturation factor